jgi:hypothetical protein
MAARRVLPALAVACLVAGTVSSSGASTSTRRAPGAVERILVVTLPSVGWSAVDPVETPHLWRLFEDAAVGNLTARTVGRADLAAGYLTFGAGTRAAAARSPIDGAGMQPHEPWGSVTARDAFWLDTGHDVATGVLSMAIEATRRVNAATDVDTTIGALGDSLARAGHPRTVIANGDGASPEQTAQLRRAAVGALMDADGIVPAGRSDASLLEPAPDDPFGVRLAHDEVEAAFGDAWQPGAVVLVEASDLVRADAFRSLASADQGALLARRALRRSDALVGRLLARVDPTRDAVVVVNPIRAPGTALGVAAVRAPEVPAGLLSSGSTRRSGYVLLADMAPTVLGLLGLSGERDMAGSRATVGAAKPLESRVERLVNGGEMATFRDLVRTPVTLAYGALVTVVLLGASFAFARRGAGRRGTLLPVASLTIISAPVSVFAARLVPFHHWSVVIWWLFVAGATVALAAAVFMIGRARGDLVLLVAFACAAGLLLVDVVTGARLQLNSAFGYTPTVGIRVSGLGNIAYALLGTSAIFVAAFAARRVGSRRGWLLACAVLLIVLVVDVAPFWGSDVGGVLSLVPAFGVTLALLSGVPLRVSWRTAALAATATVIALGIVTAVDLARPAESRTHLGRLAQRVRDEGAQPGLDTIRRKLDSNLDTWSTSDWRIALVASAAFMCFVLLHERGRLRALLAEVPQMRAALAGTAVLAGLGYAFNDSGVVVPAVVLPLVAAAIVVMLTDSARAEGGPGPAPARPGVAER